ncbi:hypothetical protein BDV25DRAFT_123457 [Aspergillus avenaceus]|uniref:Uncharacterized protein n=1 Tax=Aspergillus avenaceus TaxID=36643 RepID=A0A5N6TUA8_ASPAV|nr:hypothetical protein BDV25DRAFT_123457 [Aspergillus avenaceus]
MIPIMDTRNGHFSLRGQFSSTLRSRAIWRIIEPVLTALVVSLEEAELRQCDFVLYSLHRSLPLRVLLLGPSSIDSKFEPETVSRLTQFYHSISNSQNHAVVFLCSEDAFNRASGKYSLDGLLALQVLMAEVLPSLVPIIPVSDSSCFLSCMEQYFDNLIDIPQQNPTLSESITVLSHATAGSPNVLCEQDTNILSDLFPSMRTLSQATRTIEGREVLVDYLGEKKAEPIIGFWGDDVIRE